MFNPFRKPEPPLLLADPVLPAPELWRSANALFDHPRGCRCSTCTLAANLGQVVQEQRAIQPDARPEPTQTRVVFKQRKRRLKETI
jgi:hypothetical protein